MHTHLKILGVNSQSFMEQTHWHHSRQPNHLKLCSCSIVISTKWHKETFFTKYKTVTKPILEFPPYDCTPTNIQNHNHYQKITLRQNTQIRHANTINAKYKTHTNYHIHYIHQSHHWIRHNVAFKLNSKQINHNSHTFIPTQSRYFTQSIYAQTARFVDQS